MDKNTELQAAGHNSASSETGKTNWADCREIVGDVDGSDVIIIHKVCDLMQFDVWFYVVLNEIFFSILNVKLFEVIFT